MIRKEISRLDSRGGPPKENEVEDSKKQGGRRMFAAGDICRRTLQHLYTARSIHSAHCRGHVNKLPARSAVKRSPGSAA